MKGGLVDDILWFAFPPLLPAVRRCVVTLGVYLDGAGPLPEHQALAVVGAVAPPENWIEFTSEWKQALFDFEQLPYFHMSEFENDQGSYADWRARGVKELRLNRLLGIIERHVLHSVGAAIPLDLCRRKFKGNPLAVGYYWAAMHCIMHAADYHRPNADPEEKLAYVFEAGDEGYGKVEEAYDRLSRDPVTKDVYRLISRVTTDFKDFPPLQAADILAYEALKQWGREINADPRAWN